MVFVKVLKNRAYFSRFQTKYERRRQCKTDYKARRRLVAQDKNKYNSPRYRLIVRLSNRAVSCQIAYAQLCGDKVMCAAYSSELQSFGAKAGFSNYAACYATGLLCGRRMLKQLGLDTKYEGNKEVGEFYEVEPMDDGPRPFKALLDVGLARTTRGSRIFAAMKGACDAGINVPHSEKRLAGYNKDSNELDSEFLRKRILGGHVAEYQEQLKGEDAEAYDRLFSQYKKAGLAPDAITGMWEKVHANIRANPARAKKSKK
eukprot:NODE_1218_length_948_cov_387.587089_g1172_i0.p1 GENE.NODE_1218_length_948_cov_387.587089_g1172_i0~~NODE_1218_length_948_cov_387.587089_g1172_i0.p1  ORF type:complete len:259 (-),score=53.02 NODE_1218_length_948_cov_387.587089_g1172_i0:97-873(-)